ncbi:uncharacterized protein LOC117583319 [Drosophila guanche]|uniref:Uncharacterized protein n=1 Tax=Drosophila guanche TaxID=7266 RepID=A0A3B0K0L7_DROGU|nr:uncharacterized protein LOC117583319 [Drosophila guanche]SPP81340.1 Hypothetical predicted protein [Drosophila guanche]
MKTSLLSTLLMVVLGVMLAHAAINPQSGYPDERPGEELQQLTEEPHPREQRLKERAGGVVVKPAQRRQLSSRRKCNNKDGNPKAEAAALARYHAARPPLRRLSRHKEVQVDSEFFEPSPERVEELKRILLDQQ